MSERIPRTTAPDPTEKTPFRESPIWEVNNQEIGDLVDKYLGETYVLDGKEYTVWFARPAGSVKSEMYISEFDLQGENGESIEGISSKDLAARIDRDNMQNAEKQSEQSDSGAYKTHEVENASADEQQQGQPSKVELAKREDYIFKKAGWHLNREFNIADRRYRIDGIYYGGSDGAYTTDAVDILNLETGVVTRQLTIPELEMKIAAEQPYETINPTERTEQALGELAKEQSQAVTERINKELKTTFAPTTPTVDMINDADPTEDSLEQKRRDAIEEFDKLVADNSEYEELRDEFMKDLDVYIQGLGTDNQSNYELAQ